MTDKPFTDVEHVITSESVTKGKKYIGDMIDELHIQDGCEVTIVLGKGSKVNIINEGGEE